MLECARLMYGVGDHSSLGPAEWMPSYFTPFSRFLPLLMIT